MLSRRKEKKMDQQKIGAFLKDLRKERNITQEQLADKMMVSRRTVSRWETGSNMPDLDILIDISEFYDVDLKEILNGERKSEPMDKEMKETVMKVAEYSNDEKERMLKRFNIMFIALFVFLTLALIVLFVDAWGEQVRALVNGICMGIGYGVVILGVIVTSRYAKKIHDFKMRLIGKKSN